MLRIFSYTNPIGYLLLLVLVFGLRSATFQAEYAAPSESRNWVVAQRMAEGAAPYTEIWDHRPPVTALVYRAAFAFAGSYGLVLLRILACLYIVLCSMVIHLILIEYRIEFRLTFFPPFLLALLLCSPWYALEVNEELLMILPVLLCMRLLIRYFVDGESRPDLLYAVGIWCGICISIKYQGLVLLLTSLVVVIFMSRNPLRELVTVLGGSLTVLMLFFVWLYFQGSLQACWDQTFLYLIDRIRIADHFPTETPIELLLEQLAVEGLVFVLGARAWIYLRRRPAAAAIRERRIELILTIWLIGTGSTLFIAAAQTRVPHYWLVFPVLTFFLSVHIRATRQSIRSRLMYLPAQLILLIGSFSYLIFLNPNTYKELQRNLKAPEYLSRLHARLHPSPEEQEARAYLQSHTSMNGILAAFPDPTFYLRVGQPCGVRYTDFSMALIKMDWLSINHRQSPLISRSEPLSLIYNSFLAEQPDLIFDRNGVFGEIQQSIPLLLHQYKAEDIGQFTVYKRSIRASDQYSFPP